MRWIDNARLLVAAWLLCSALLGGCSKPAGSTSGSRSGRDGGAQLELPKDLKRYDVLLVTLDTTRVDYVSCYDQAHGELTPYVDAVAEDGVRFDFGIAQSAGTPMSHASILTGLNPYEHGVRVISAAGGYELSREIPTLTTVLRQHGWRTGAFLSAFTVSEYYGFDHGFDAFDNGLAQEADTIVEDITGGHRRWDQRTHQRRSDRTIDQALSWLRADDVRPFFMWLHLWDPHDRMVLPPKEILRRFVKPRMVEDDYKRAVYRAEVHYMDSQFGRLIEALKADGRYDNTIIAIVGDHGQGLGQHNWWSHRLLYQEDLHVPLIIRVPGWPTGRVIPELVRTIDIYPTLLEVLGIPVGAGIAGTSLRRLIAGEPEPPRLAYADQINKYDMVNRSISKERPKDDLLYCAMDRTWKLIYRHSRPEESELYNLSADPHELNNVYAQYPDEAKRLKAALDKHNGYVTAPFVGSGAPDATVLQHLEALGYVGSADDEDDPNRAGPDDKPAPPPTTRPTTQP